MRVRSEEARWLISLMLLGAPIFVRSANALTKRALGASVWHEASALPGRCLRRAADRRGPHPLVATAGPVDADDCFQETWISALRAYPRLRRTDNIRGVAPQDRPEQGDRRAPGASPGGPCRWRPVPDRAAPPGAPASVDATPGGLPEAVRSLPPAKQRTAVYCRSVLGMPYHALAELLESSEEAARPATFTKA